MGYKRDTSGKVEDLAQYNAFGCERSSTFMCPKDGNPRQPPHSRLMSGLHTSGVFDPARQGNRCRLLTMPPPDAAVTTGGGRRHLPSAGAGCLCRDAACRVSICLSSASVPPAAPSRPPGATKRRRRGVVVAHCRAAKPRRLCDRCRISFGPRRGPLMPYRGVSHAGPLRGPVCGSFGEHTAIAPFGRSAMCYNRAAPPALRCAR